MNKTAFILRGVSGSGKSTLANTLASMSPDSIICEADQYFINREGEYKFDPSRLGAAHAYCLNLFKLHTEKGTSVIICSNTNASEKEYLPYVNLAKQQGYTVHVIVVERFMNTQSIHLVPEETIKKQTDKLRLSIRF
jgi:predicted ABC-type ATPase